MIEVALAIPTQNLRFPALVLTTNLKPLSLYNNFVRAKEIITILARYGFADLLQQLDTPPALLKRLVSTEQKRTNTWQSIRFACEELGPTFVKIAQILSTRGDVLPQPLINELKHLRNQVRAQDFEQMRAVLEEELQCEYTDHFKDLDPTPIAAGSLGQVYRATLVENNKPVAVKIQRPNIHKAITADLEIIAWLARQMHNHIEAMRPFDLPTVIEETRKGLLQEIDFTNEARNATLFNALNPNPDKIFAPEVHETFTTQKVIVSDWVEGISPDNLELSKEEREALAEIAGASVMHQIVITGFFHGDPHSGNLTITPDRRLCFLDWGLAGLLTREMRYFLADFFAALASQDPERVVHVASRISQSDRRLDIPKMEKDVIYVLRKYQQFLETGEEFGRVGLELLHVFGSNGIPLARDYTILVKAVISLEETGKTLDPNFDIRTAAKPFLESLTWERWNPMSVLKTTLWNLRLMLKRFHELPADFQRVLRRFEAEDLSINLHHKGLTELNETINSMSNRIAIAVITGSLLLGSSVIITTGIKPLLWGFPAFGIIGYIISATLALWIIVDILRHGGHR